MSRSLGRLLVLLALWMQILAPVTAVQAVLAADNPLAGMTICGQVVDAAADGQADDHRGMAMPLCGLCCAAIAVLDAAPPESAGLVLAWTPHAFTPAAETSASAARPYRPQARGPPSLA